MDNIIGKYLDNVCDLLKNISKDDIANIAQLLKNAYDSEKQVFFIGNGGSAATASHLVADFQKNVGLLGKKQFRIMALVDNMPLLTAWSNDFDYSCVFSEQLKCWLNAGDFVIAISGSGNSPNVISAIELANEKKAVTVGLTGFKGGKLGQIAQHNINVESEDMQHIEDVHMVLGHLLYQHLIHDIKEDSQ